MLCVQIELISVLVGTSSAAAPPQRLPPDRESYSSVLSNRGEHASPASASCPFGSDDVPRRKASMPIRHSLLWVNHSGSFSARADRQLDPPCALVNNSFAGRGINGF